MNDIKNTNDIRLVPLDHMKIGPAAEDFHEFMKTRIVGQRRGIDWCADVAERIQQNFLRPNKPAGSVLLVGGTGSGKTSLAKAFAEFLFGDENGLTRIDCANYSASHMVARLLGAPPGYVGYGDEPFFTQRKLDKPCFDAIFRFALNNLNDEARQEYYHFREAKDSILRTLASVGANHPKRPDFLKRLNEVEMLIQKLGLPIYDSTKNIYWSVFLLDEFEKADIALLRLVLRILDDAQLQLTSPPEDGGSDIIDFHHTIIIATSNLGTGELSTLFDTASGKNTGFKFVNENLTSDELSNSVYRICSKAVNAYFPPELMARFDDMIAFGPPTRENIFSILEIEFLKFQRQLFDSRGLNFPVILRIHNDVKVNLVDEMSDSFGKGVRNLQQKLQKHIGKGILRMKATGQIVAGDIIHISHDPSKKYNLRFEKELQTISNKDIVLVE